MGRLQPYPQRRSYRDRRPDEGLGDVVGVCDKALDRRLEIEEQPE